MKTINPKACFQNFSLSTKRPAVELLWNLQYGASFHWGVSHMAQDALHSGSHVNYWTRTFLWRFGLLSWTSGDCILIRMFQTSGLQHLGWWSSHCGIPWEGKRRRLPVLPDKSCLSRAPHHTWDGTFEPMFPSRGFSRGSANRTDELEQTGAYVKIYLNGEGKQDMCPCAHNSSGKLIPSHSQGWSTPPEDLIIPHFFSILKTDFKKKCKLFLEWLQPRAVCEWNMLQPGGSHSVF